MNAIVQLCPFCPASRARKFLRDFKRMLKLENHDVFLFFSNQTLSYWAKYPSDRWAPKKKKKVFLFFRILKCPGWKAAKTSSGCQKFCCRDGQISRVAYRSSERGKMLITWPAGGSTCYWWQVKGWRNENRFNGIKCVVNLDENPATPGCLELASHSCIHPFDLSWFIISPPTFMRSVV